MQPIDEDVIVQALEAACGNEGLIFQVIQELPYLYVYVNRLEEQPLDYEALIQQVFATITRLPLTDITGLGIFSRPCDVPDPDWQTFLDLSTAVESGQANDSLPIDDASEPIQEPLTHQNSGTAELIQVAEPETTAQVEAVVNAESAAPADPGVAIIANAAVAASAPTQDSPVSFAAPPKGLADYCFIRNKALLTTKILPPEPNIATLIKFFDDQPEASQLELLPVLDVYLRTPKPELIEAFSPDVQAWLEQLGQLKDMDARNIAIWLSRYCVDPAQTMAAVTAVLTDKPLAPEPAPSAAGNPIHTGTTVAAGNSTSSYSGNATYTPRVSSPTPSVPDTATPAPTRGLQAGKLPQGWALMLLVGWVLVTLIFIIVSVKSLDPTKMAKEACIKSSNQPYCALALQVTGKATIEEALPPKRFALSEGDKEHALKVCYTAAVLEKMRSNLPKFREAMESVSSPQQVSSTEVLPDLLLVDFQYDEKKPGTLVRTACTFAKQEAEDVPELIGHAQIPVDWPKTAFTPAKITSDELRRVLGKSNLFITLGVGTLFTALAIFVAAYFRVGVEVNSFEALGMAAFGLGLIDMLLQSFSLWGLIGWIAIQSLALGLISWVVKGFRVRWEDGYRWVSFGTFLITLVRLYLNVLFFNFLAGLV